MEKAGCSQTPSGRKMRAFLSNTRQATDNRKCVSVSVCAVTVSLCSGACRLTFPHATHTKRSLISVNEMMLNGLQKLWWHDLPHRPVEVMWLTTIIRKKQDKKDETPLASNQNGSNVSSSVCPVHKLPPLFFSPAIPPAGRCNLLPFTPCQRMTMFRATTHYPQGNGIATVCMTTGGWHVAPSRAVPMKSKARACDIPPRLVRAHQDTICTLN